MHSAQLQPGCSVIRDALDPPIRTISTVVLSGARVSSGAEKSRTSKPAIEASLAWSLTPTTILNRCGNAAQTPLVGKGARLRERPLAWFLAGQLLLVLGDRLADL